MQERFTAKEPPEYYLNKMRVFLDPAGNRSSRVRIVNFYSFLSFTFLTDMLGLHTDGWMTGRRCGLSLFPRSTQPGHPSGMQRDNTARPLYPWSRSVN